MAENERTPVLVGAAQLVQRDVDPTAALDPLEMLVRVATCAAEDAGCGERLLHDLDLIGIVDVVGWRPKNGPRLLAERLGARPRREIVTGIGGEIPLTLVNHVAGEIARGRTRIALVAGASTLRTLRKARRAGLRLEYPQGGEGDAELFGERKPGSSELETRYGLSMPIHVYPVFENALRAQRGLTLDAHRGRIGALMSRFTKVAAANEYAWFPTERSADELTTTTPPNRMIGFPYPKYLNAVIETDQAAGVLLMSAAAALSLGVPRERLVYFSGGAHGVEAQWFVSERPNFHSCAAMHQTLAGALARAGVTVDEIDHFDFYSCFPIAIEMACEALGLAEDDPRGFTVTGGLPYAGGPGNNYTLHSLAAMFDRLRAAPGTRGLVTGNGWYLTKHSASVWSSVPPRAPGAAQALTTPVDGSRPVPLAEPAQGEGRVEAYTVVYDREGAPQRGIVIGRLSDGRRFLSNTAPDRALLEELVGSEMVGRRGALSHVDGMNRFDPS